MITGIGIDLIEIKRVERACGRESFLSRAFTEKERREVSDNVRRLAGDFAAKEAVAKALGTGFNGFGPEDIEVLRDGLGRPYVNLYRGAKKRAEALGADRILVSITDTDEYVAAMAVAENTGCSGQKT